MTFKGYSKEKRTEAYIGHVGAYFKPLINLKSPHTPFSPSLKLLFHEKISNVYSKRKGTKTHIGHVGVHFKAVIISRSATYSIFTATQFGFA